MTGTKLRHAELLKKSIEQVRQQCKSCGSEISTYAKAATFLAENRPLRYGIGFDGSKLSEKCFKVAVNMADSARGDRLYVLHVETNKNSSEAKAETERRHTQVQLLADKAGAKITWFQETLQDGESICTALMRLVEKIQVDFVILGSYGLTAEGDQVGGPQVNMNAFLKEKGVLTATSDETIRSVDTSVVLVKTTAFELSKARVWMLACDDSAASESAFALIQRMARDGDTVHVVHASSADTKASWMDMYEQELAKRPKIERKVHIVPALGGMSVLDTITKHAKTVQPDFLVTGVADYRTGKPIGSFSMGIARDCRCTTILIKDPHEVTEHRIRKSNLEKYLANAAKY